MASWTKLCGKDSLKMFGFWKGIGFLIRMDVIDPIKMWYWDTFHTRPYCQWSGWYCKNKYCEHVHHYRRPKPKDYPIKPGDKCEYCGENPATSHIHNPNLDQKPWYWKVCSNCEKLIPLQEDQAWAAHMMMTMPTDGVEKMFKEKTEEIAAFEKKTGVKTMSTMIMPMEDGSLQAHELRKHDEEA